MYPDRFHFLCDTLWFLIHGLTSLSLIDGRGFLLPPPTVRVLWRGTTPDLQTETRCVRRVHLRHGLLRLWPALSHFVRSPVAPISAALKQVASYGCLT